MIIEECQKNGGLGIFTKSQAMPVNKGFQPRLHEYLLQDQSAKLLPTERVCNCLKRRIDKEKKRSVMFNESRNKAHWGNVQRCGSIWSCPVCAKQITEKRRSEMNALLDYWRDQDDSDIKLMTLTFSHSQSEPLKVLLKQLKHAITRFFGHRKFKELSTACNIEYKVRSLEVTYGSNGWHPHFHILLLTRDIDDQAFYYRDSLAKLWIDCCIKSGLSSPSMKHGLDIRDGSYAEDYIAKWGLDNEMTKGHVKRGKSSSLTPFDLLQKSFDDELYFHKLPSKLFQEFVIAMKGARQLVWSRGLKDLIGLNDKTDQDIVDETDKESITLIQVEKIVFDILKKYQKRHEYLKWVEDDYNNGCLGNGSAELNLNELIQLEINQFESHEIDFMTYRGII
ncbi:protein rep [Acinetobacter sp. neg1]|uniref:protein rep n=1 Tax=Acinetobacter sp. neg1 TaxID=1561068 RepID=UPI0006490A95|nr:protein rep [Acinetobacter sp. neg1]